MARARGRRTSHELDLALKYAAWALHTAAGRERHRAGVLFKPPAKTDPQHLLVHAEQGEHDGITSYRIQPDHLRRRDGFALTDPGTDLVGALDQANYCIWCHDAGQGFLLERPAREGRRRRPRRRSRRALRRDARRLPARGEDLRVPHAKTRGARASRALAIIVVDNPIAAATGHRICNDCMKSCIYQKQEPVDIPQAETRTLKDVLELPWGFEIYSLLDALEPAQPARGRCRGRAPASACWSPAWGRPASRSRIT